MHPLPNVTVAQLAPILEFFSVSLRDRPECIAPLEFWRKVYCHSLHGATTRDICCIMQSISYLMSLEKLMILPSAPFFHKILAHPLNEPTIREITILIHNVGILSTKIAFDLMQGYRGFLSRLFSHQLTLEAHHTPYVFAICEGLRLLIDKRKLLVLPPRHFLLSIVEHNSLAAMEHEQRARILQTLALIYMMHMRAQPNQN